MVLATNCNADGGGGEMDFGLPVLYMVVPASL